MSIIELRLGPETKKKQATVKLISTEDTFSVRFRNPISNALSAKSELKLPFLLNRNIHARSKACPPGLALFRVTPDVGASSLPGMDNPITVTRNSAMNCIRSQIGHSNSQVIACYHTYQRYDEQGARSEELIPSGKLFLEFHRLLNQDIYHQIFEHFHLLVDRSIPYWEGAYVVSLTHATGSNPVKLTELLQKLEFIHEGKKYPVFDYVDPIFHHGRTLPSIPQDPVFAYQWHLRNDGLSQGDAGVDIGAPEAWDMSKGSKHVRVAVIDDAFDLSPRTFDPELIVSPLNLHTGTQDVSPTRDAGEWHGTSVLGLISSAHGRFGGCGVAPDCPVIPIKLEPLVDDDVEARAFDHAVSSGAAVINCSWGPYDNYSHQVWPIPRLTQLAIENAYRNDVAVVFAAGNGAENIETDGYAGNSCVIAVSASTDRDQRAYYSDYGERVWLCAPSSGGGSSIVTSDIFEGGRNLFGGQTTEFGGTSAAAPLVSGVIALMQSAFLDKNPDQQRLSVEEIRAILRLSARHTMNEDNPKFTDYWDHDKLIDPVSRKPERHSLVFGYGCVNAAASVRMASTWKRNLNNKERLDNLQETTHKVRKEPKVLQRRSMRRIKTSDIELTLPVVLVGDPLAIFQQHRDGKNGFSANDKSRFNAGEHIWLGTQGFREACTDIGEDFQQYATISRGDKLSKEKFTYGELVALSGDFYRDPDELFFEKPAFIPWMYESNDFSDLRVYFNKEIDAIKQQMTGAELSYPDYNIQYAWNAKNYMELAKDNESHFAWHNMVKYCHCHAWALYLAIKSGMANEDYQGRLWRKSLYINAFADHFLTDGFAAGHIRVPRKQIINWAAGIGLSDTTSGFLSKLLHDQDGHLDTNHIDGHKDNDGLHVINSLGDEWWARCDGQLFINTKKDSLQLRQPILAVKESVLELFNAKKSKEYPEGIYKATNHVPFPHPEELALTKKFNPDDLQNIKQWVDGVDWYNFGVNEDNVVKLFTALPDLMHQFRVAVKKDLDPSAIKLSDSPIKTLSLSERLPKKYIQAYSSINK